MILSGKELSDRVNAENSVKCSAFVEKTGRKPCLAVVLVGEDPASVIYVRNKKKACDLIGIEHRDISYEATASEQTILDCVASLNADPTVDGILVQFPLPAGLDSQKVLESISPSKDVDGFNPVNVGRMFQGQDALQPCTPKGIMRLIDYYGIETKGMEVCIVGRSNTVGKPLAAMMMQKGRDATVTVCHTSSKDLDGHIASADIVVAAAGHPGLVRGDNVREGAVVIDVGINRVPDSTKKTGYAVKGDADYDAIVGKAYAITPVPGGVGPMTVCMLMENTLVAACSHEGLDFKSL